MMGDWPAVRVLAICLGWIVLAPLMLLWRVALGVHTGSAGVGLAGVPTPSKLVLVTFLPPVLLFGVWLLARSRPD
jgi:hypothetical protein